MKTLFLVRHAKSSWDFPELCDHDRPLNRRGRNNAPEMGKRIFSKGICADLMISSTALRTIETARLMAQEMRYSGKIIQERKLFHADTREILSVIHEIDDRYNTVFLFAHNPGITSAVNLLAEVTIQNIPTCGYAHLIFPYDHWHNIQAGAGELMKFDFPKSAQNKKRNH